jgi:hypothetical protein
MMPPWARFAAVIVIPAAVLAFFQIVDPAISNALTGLGHTVVEPFSCIGQVIADTLGRYPFETTFSIATAVIQPLAVKTKDAWTMLGCSNAHGYKLITEGQIDSYLNGRIRLVTVASIQAYVEKQVAAAKKDKGPKRTEQATAASVARRAERKVAEGTPGRPRKPAPIAAAPIAAEEATPGT